MIALYLAIIIVCLIFSAFFSCSDTAYSTVNVMRLKKAAQNGSKTAASALDYVKNYDNTIAAILFGNNLVNIAASSFGTLLAYLLFPDNSELGTLIVSMSLVVIILIFGEILPKTIGRVYNYRLALVLVYPIKVIKIIFFPFVWCASHFANLLLKPFFRRHEDPDSTIPSDEELESMVEDIREEGIIDEDQSEFIFNSLRFRETTAEEIMTPRVDIQGYDCSKDFSEWAHTPGNLTRSRVPVYRVSLDEIIGYLPSKTLLKSVLNEEPLDLKSFLLPIVAVPSTMEISSVLRLMKKSHHHIAVVKDEYGGTAGILTLEDILEELVGELYDESEEDDPEIERGEKRNQFIVSGSMNIHDFFYEFDLDDESLDDDYNTVSGWLTDHLEAFPKVGDELSYDKLDIVVTAADEYTATEIEVTKHPRRKKKKSS